MEKNTFLEAHLNEIYENINSELDKKTLREEIELLKEKIKILEIKLASD